MSRVILSCSSLEKYIYAAQEKMHTDYPVVMLDRKYHVEPQQMQQHILDTIDTISADVDTLLVAMGFCGGSWANLSFDKRIIIPRVDDCVTLLLHTNDNWHPNLKETGHLYMFDEDSAFSPEGIYQSLREQYEDWKADMLFDMWFENYSHLDIIDTGMYDCYNEEYVQKMQKSADLIHSTLDYVEGGNIVLEKLVSGQWDEQFLVVEPGTVISHGDFFE